MKRLICLLLLASCAVATATVFAQDDAALAPATAVVVPESPGKSVAIAVTVVKVAPDATAEKELPSSVDLAAALKQWEEQGRLQGSDSIQFTALSGQKSTVQFGARKPVVTGTTYTERTKQLVHGYTYEDVGFIVTAAPSIEADGAIVLALAVERSDFETTKPPQVTPIDGNLPAVANEPPPTIHLTQIRSAARLREQAAVLGRKIEKNGHSQVEYIVFASARLTP